jgi:uncharacterized protein YgfB (UPF0149 family)
MSNDIITKTIEEVVSDLADLSYVVLDLKEDIANGESSKEESLEKINFLYEGLIFNQDRLLIFNDRDETEGHTIQ